MNKTAAAQSKLASKLIRLAHAATNPSDAQRLLGQAALLNPRVAAFLKAGDGVQASLSKSAIKEDTQDFIQWALNTQQPMDAREVRSFVERTLRIDTQPPITRRPGPRFLAGDQVIIRAAKHTDATSKAVYEQFNGKIGTVDDTDGQDVLVAFKGEPAPIRFPGGLKPRGVGIYKYTPAFTITGSAKIEMVYLADPSAKPSDDQKAIVEVYLERSRGTEKRSANYYTGYVATARLAQDGGWYFQAMPQQRLEVDPDSEAGYQFRSFNPAKGKVLYIGVLNKRPPGWEKELDQLRDQSGDS